MKSSKSVANYKESINPQTTTNNTILAVLSNLLSTKNNSIQRNNNIRVLVLGKTGSGKSTTINSILNDYLTEIGALTDKATEQIIHLTKTWKDLTISLIDTPGLVEGDIISEVTLLKIKNFLTLPNNEMDVILFCDRMDIYHVEPIDRKIFQCLTKHFGVDIWRRMILTLTRSGITNPPNGMSYQDFTHKRATSLKQAAYKAGCPGPLPVVYVENHRARVSQEGQLLLPDGTAWIPALANELIRRLESSTPPYRYNPKLEKFSDHNCKKKSLIPFILFIQISFREIIKKNLTTKNGHSQSSEDFTDW